MCFIFPGTLIVPPILPLILVESHPFSKNGIQFIYKRKWVQLDLDEDQFLSRDVLTVNDIEL